MRGTESPLGEEEVAKQLAKEEEEEAAWLLAAAAAEAQQRAWRARIGAATEQRSAPELRNSTAWSMGSEGGGAAA